MENNKRVLVGKLCKEQDDLIEKITNLNNFMNSNNYLRLDKQHQKLLLKQFKYMMSYFYTLTDRINLLMQQYNQGLIKELDEQIKEMDFEKEI